MKIQVTRELIDKLPNIYKIKVAFARNLSYPDFMELVDKGEIFMDPEELKVRKWDSIQ